MCLKNNLIFFNQKHQRIDTRACARLEWRSRRISFGKKHFSFSSDSFNQAVCSWNIDRLLHKPSHSGQDAETSLTPSPSCLKQLLHC